MAVNIYDLQIENAKELIKIYSKRSEQLKKAILSIVKSGGDSSTLTREKKRIDDILTALRKELKELTAAQIEYSYTQGQETTKKDYKALKIGLLIGAVLPDKGKKELTKTYHSHIDWAIDRMQSKLNAFVRKDFSTVNQAIKNVESLAYNRLGLIVPSNLDKTKDLNGLAQFFETQLKARDIFRVPYYHRTGSKAGKVFSHVRTENYCKMLARTLTAEADRKAVTDIIEKTFEPYGDLVQFVRRGGGYSEHSCDDCDFLLNTYLSLHGETKGYTTVPEAENEYDIFHPNCIHTLRITDGVLQQYEYLGVNVPRDKQSYKIEPYVPHYDRQPNPDFKYDENKINQILNNVDPVYIDSNNVPTFKNKKKLREWAKGQFLENRHVIINSDNENILLSIKNMKRATEKQNANDKKINAVFLKIREILQNAQYYDFEPIDKRHSEKNILGQYVYYSKIIIDKTPYKVRFKIDVPAYTYGELQYAGHRLIKM